jgi:four helix bundle protein
LELGFGMAEKIKNYRDLQVWQKAMQFTKKVYITASNLPHDERYGLSSQMKRSAVSISANIAEGHSRNSTKDFIRFLNIAYGSLSETETHLILAKELNMASTTDLEELLIASEEIGRMLTGLKRSLEAKS